MLQVVDALGAACRLPGRLHGGQQQGDQDRDDRDHDQQLDQGKTEAFPWHEKPPMMTLGLREPVATPQGVGIKPTGHTLAPTRLVGLSTFPLATDPESAAISDGSAHFGLAADFFSSSASSFLKSSRWRSGSRAPSVRNRGCRGSRCRRPFSAGPSPGRPGPFPRRPTRPCPLARPDPRARRGRRPWGNHIAFRQPQPFREPQCMPDVGRRAGGVAQSPAGPPAPDQRSDQVAG